MHQTWHMGKYVYILGPGSNVVDTQKSTNETGRLNMYDYLCGRPVQSKTTHLNLSYKN